MNYEELFARRTRAVASGRFSDLIDQYADDAVVHQPFARPAPITLRGRDEIAKHLAMGEAVPLAMGVRNVVLHHTADPEVFIAEYDYDLRATATGRTGTVANIQVFRVRDGLIIETRDYHDHIGIGRILAAED